LVGGTTHTQLRTHVAPSPCSPGVQRTAASNACACQPPRVSFPLLRGAVLRWRWAGGDARWRPSWGVRLLRVELWLRLPWPRPNGIYTRRWGRRRRRRVAERCAATMVPRKRTPRHRYGRGAGCAQPNAEGAPSGPSAIDERFTLWVRGRLVLRRWRNERPLTRHSDNPDAFRRRCLARRRWGGGGAPDVRSATTQFSPRIKWSHLLLVPFP